MKTTLTPPASIERLEDALVAWHDLWWRTPERGRGGVIAKDGPWHLGQFEAGDVASLMSLTILTTETGREIQVMKLDTPAPRSPLSSKEVTARDEMDGWLEAIPEVVDRDLVRQVTLQAWRGHRRDWGFVARRVGSGRSVNGLRLRYRKVMGELVCRLNGVPMRFAGQLSARDAILSHPAMAQEC